MDGTLWAKIKERVLKGAAVVTERAGELSRIGKVRLDIARIKRDRGIALEKLGERIYALDQEGALGELGEREEVRKLIEQVKALEGELKLKEAELEVLREGKETSEGAGAP
ncbi:MAG TPA: hypothetical protein EYP17_10960 [Candidatus Latescibacteria bacterium]|nr:hypothetical protein [Candidatus Latescibacterota bacterium]